MCLISLVAYLKVLALSGIKVAGKPLCSTNLQNAKRKELTCNLSVSSRWMALVKAHIETDVGLGVPPSLIIGWTPYLNIEWTCKV